MHTQSQRKAMPSFFVERLKELRVLLYFRTMRSAVYLFFSFLLLPGIGNAQSAPVPMGTIPDSAGFAELRIAYAKNKTIPASFEREIYSALSFFPELKDHRIDFVLRKGYAPLSSRPSFGGLLRSARKRTYKVFISTGSGRIWDSILLDKAPYNARIGVLGHELAHVLNFSRMSGVQLGWLGVSHVSKSYMNRFEFRTDSLAIAKGMGEYLYAMSTHVRRVFGSPDPEERTVTPIVADYKQRYMGPATIRLYMESHPPYRGTSTEVR
jgi:hypothetical protein